MAIITQADYDRLKSQLLEVDALRETERACLLRIISTYAKVVDTFPDYGPESSQIGELVNTAQPISVDEVEASISQLRRKIFDSETASPAQNRDETGPPDSLLRLACRAIKRTMILLLEDFYPLDAKMKTMADRIDISFHDRMTTAEVDGPTKAFHKFIKILKTKISSDFRQIHEAFIALLNQTRELETTLSDEYGLNVRQTAIEHFEMKMKSEVGSIAEAFDVHSSIESLKSTVTSKLSQINQIMAERKKTELKQARRTQKRMEKLKKRLASVENDARKISQKAEFFQKAATKDGLTELYNRKAFDTKLRQTFNLYEGTGDPFAVILFDVDRFKWINDTFGHLGGDKVLKVIAVALFEIFRQNDFVARIGGDEFAVIVEGMNRQMAAERIRRFSDHFKQKRFYSHKYQKNIAIELSAGIGIVKPGDTPAQLLHRADQAMYQTKNQRKADQAAASPPSSPPSSSPD